MSTWQCSKQDFLSDRAKQAVQTVDKLGVALLGHQDSGLVLSFLSSRLVCRFLRSSVGCLAEGSEMLIVPYFVEDNMFKQQGHLGEGVVSSSGARRRRSSRGRIKE